MKRLILLQLFIALGVFCFAQNKVALHSAGTSTIFSGSTPFIDAYEAAVNGDTVYLPGAVLSAPSVLNKSLIIIGAGHNPDSTVATNRTVISNPFNIQEDADGIQIEGIYFVGTITFYNNHKVDNAVISRCNIGGGISFAGSGTAPCENVVIKECILTAAVYMTNASGCTITNSILQNQLFNGNNNYFYHNIFTYHVSTSYIVRNVLNSSLTGNIFLNGNNYVFITCDGSTFSNNVFYGSPNNTTVVTMVNNYLNVGDVSLLFVSQSGNVFDYDHDYHLVTPATYTPSGETQAGIYGGVYVFKEGSVPSNPHISIKEVATSTDDTGVLNIRIVANAQED